MNDHDDLNDLDYHSDLYDRRASHRRSDRLYRINENYGKWGQAYNYVVRALRSGRSLRSILARGVRRGLPRRTLEKAVEIATYRSPLAA